MKKISFVLNFVSKLFFKCKYFSAKYLNNGIFWEKFWDEKPRRNKILSLIYYGFIVWIYEALNSWGNRNKGLLTKCGIKRFIYCWMRWRHWPPLLRYVSEQWRRWTLSSNFISNTCPHIISFIIILLLWHWTISNKKAFAICRIRWKMILQMHHCS